MCDKNIEAGEDLSYLIDKKTRELLRMHRDGNVWVIEAVVDEEDIPEDFVRQG